MSFSGNRAFKSCQVKKVEFTESVYVSGRRGDVVISSDPANDSRYFAGNGAILDCPVTEERGLSVESQYNSHRSRTAAQNSLRKIAGELICGDCRFATMSKVEVEQERTLLAELEARRLEAEKFQAEARKELEQEFPTPRIDLTE